MRGEPGSKKKRLDRKMEKLVIAFMRNALFMEFLALLYERTKLGSFAVHP
jgi:hypothetical protein